MRKTTTPHLLLILIAFFSFASTSCKKEKEKEKIEEKPEVIVPVQKPVLFYFGGTWNLNCGDYGKSALEGITNQFGDDAVIISCQMNGGPGITDSMNNMYSNQFANFFDVSTSPIIYIGGDDSLTYAIGKNDLEYHSKIRSSSILEKKPVIYSKPKVSINGNKIKVNVNTEILEDINSEVRMTVLIKESNLKFKQANDSRTENTNIHHHVLRMNLTDSPTGISLKVSPKKGDKLPNEFEDDLPHGFKKDFSHVVVIYWVKVEGGYRCLNAEQVKLDKL